MLRKIEKGSWDTSKAYVRRTLENCIKNGREFRKNNDEVCLYRAYRLLGQAVRFTSVYFFVFILGG